MPCLSLLAVADRLPLPHLAVKPEAPGQADEDAGKLPRKEGSPCPRICRCS
jgi:hypothetical protein